MPIKALFKRKNSTFLAFRAKIPDPHFTYEKTKAQRGRDLPNVTHQNGGWAGRTPSLNPQARSFNFMWLSQNQVCTMPHLFRARTMGKWQQEEKQTPASEKQEPKSLCTVQEVPLPDQKPTYSRTSTTATEDECVEYTEITLAILSWTRRGKWVKQMG